MKDFLLRIVRNPTVRKAVLALVMAILAAAGVSVGSGCSARSLPPAVAKAQATLECQIAALETVVPRSVAEDLVMAARVGNYEYTVRQLLGLGLTPEAIKGAADAFNACSEVEAADADAPATPETIPS